MFMMVTLNTLPSQVEQLCGQNLAQLDGAWEQGSSCGHWGTFSGLHSGVYMGQGLGGVGRAAELGRGQGEDLRRC